ncbi:hypothetical protein [Clostridium perfringens]|uniref:Uncharacterized protein n=1 Tax=Clostridium perfringens TaxID=1502 RepID=A0A127EHS7_CLOPF|nr:hypothetical protein [Clostridium perfringens]AMN35504.1 hypothetical protein JFP838_07000 [Clostridium perfringens]
MSDFTYKNDLNVDELLKIMDELGIIITEGKINKEGYYDLIFRINEKEVNRTLKRTNWEDYFIFT